MAEFSRKRIAATAATIATELIVVVVVVMKILLKFGIRICVLLLPFVVAVAVRRFFRLPQLDRIGHLTWSLALAWHFVDVVAVVVSVAAVSPSALGGVGERIWRRSAGSSSSDTMFAM